MIFHPDKGFIFYKNQPANWKKPTLLAILAIFLFLWGGAWFVNIFSFVSYPFLILTGRINGSFSDVLKSRNELLAAKEELAVKRGELTTAQIKIQQLQTENSQLRGIKAGIEQVTNPFMAKVLVKPGNLPYDEIIIDIGLAENSKLKVGQLVFAEDGVVLGQIEAVFNHYSRVELYSTAGVSLPVTIGAVGTPSVAIGSGGGNFSLTLPRGVSIKVGDPINTSIIGHYLLGYVAKIEQDQNNPFQKIIFRSPYNIFELSFVVLSDS